MHSIGTLEPVDIRNVRARMLHARRVHSRLRVCSNLAAAVNVVLYDRIAKRWVQAHDAFPATDGILRGVRGGYEARLDREDD